MTIKLFYFNKLSNFGDALSPLLFERLFSHKVEYADVESCDCMAVGSLLRHLVLKRWKRLARLQFRPVIVWGSGFIKNCKTQSVRNMDVRLIRGPLSAALLGLENTPFGDPGLLANELLQSTPTKRYRWGIIPHYFDSKLPTIRELCNNTPNHLLIDIAGDPDTVLQQIASCDFIASSSLHGLIAADALNIPNLWLSLSDKLIGGSWKFQDYFLSIGRKLPSPLTLGKERNLSKFEEGINTNYWQHIPEIQKGIKDSFPY